MPVIRSFIAFPAGIARMPLGKFHLYTFIGSWPWCFGLAWVGLTLGDKWNSDPRVKAAFHSADAVILPVLMLGVIAYVWHRWRGVRSDERRVGKSVSVRVDIGGRRYV